MTNHSSGPYSVYMDKCADGTPAPSVKSDSAGSIVCWTHGTSDAQAYANAVLIAKALNQLHKEPT